MLNELKGFVDVSNTSWNEKKGTVLPQFKLFKGKDAGTARNRIEGCFSVIRSILVSERLTS